ncbi:MAG: YlxR family protein [Anaerolineae bacterium]|nr:YlxR family protein [Anaerolineae bacterium]
MGTKHIPQRTCIACRTVRAKRELVRIVRTPELRVVADPTGKRAGRGAYVCRTRECWEVVLSAPKHLEHALHLEMPIRQDDLAQLREFAATLPPREQSNAVPKNEIV